MDDAIIRVLSRDLSVGTDVFRDDLLRRCLDVLMSEDDTPQLLEDDELEMLAAAGTPYDALGNSASTQQDPRAE